MVSGIFPSQLKILSTGQTYSGKFGAPIQATLTGYCLCSAEVLQVQLRGVYDEFPKTLLNGEKLMVMIW